MAHIQDRGKSVDRRWRARYRAADGRERSKAFTRRVDADRWLRDQVSSLDRGEWVDPVRSRLTFEAFVPTWRSWADGALRPTTHALNVGVLEGRLLPRFGAMPLGRISADDVRAMMADAVAEGRSSSSVRRHVLVLRSVLGLAVEHQRLVVNVAATVRLPAERAREMRTLEHGQVIAIVEAHPEWYRPLVWTAAYTGLRWGELAGLAVDRLDLLHNTIRVDRTLVDVKGQLSFGPPKTKSGARTLTIPKTVAEVLEPHLASEPVQESGLVFPTPSGKPMRRNNFGKVWRQAVKGSDKRRGVFYGTDLETLVFHELRHTAASLSIAAGAHPLTIKERLGHSSISVTMDRYGHLLPAQDEALAEALDAGLRAALEQHAKDEAPVLKVVRP
jgi:integrase